MKEEEQCNRDQLQRSHPLEHTQRADGLGEYSDRDTANSEAYFSQKTSRGRNRTVNTRPETHTTMHQEIRRACNQPKMSESNNPPKPHSEFELHQAEETLTSSTSENEVIRPPCTAKDLGPEYYAQVRLSTSQRDMLKDEAEQRDPTSLCRRHLVGITGEAGVGTLYGVPFDRRITEDYEGDNGYDLVVPREDQRDPLRVEVKTTENWSSPERTVSYEKIDQADCFVLCATHAPGRSVDIIGYAERQLLKQIGEAYGRNGYILAPEYLRPIGPMRFGPKDFRAAMQGSRRSYCSPSGK